MDTRRIDHHHAMHGDRLANLHLLRSRIHLPDAETNGITIHSPRNRPATPPEGCFTHYAPRKIAAPVLHLRVAWSRE